MGKTKKIISILLLSALLLQAAACGKGTGDTADTSASGKNAEEYIYDAEFLALNEDGTMVTAAAFSPNGMVYYVVAQEEETAKLFEMNLTTQEKKELQPGIEADMSILSIYVNEENQITLAAGQANNQLTEDSPSMNKVVLMQISPDGKTIGEIDITNSLMKDPSAYIKEIIYAKDDNYYVNAGNRILVYKTDGELLCEIPSDKYINNIFQTQDGSILASYFGDADWKMTKVDLAVKGLSDISSKITFGYGVYQEGTETDLIYTEENEMYTCNLTDEKREKIVTLTDCNISSSTLSSFKMLSDNRIAVFSMDGNTGESEVALLTLKKRSEVPEKTVITYGAFYLPYFTDKDIADFNKQSDKYRIEVKKYGDDNSDFETKINLMNAELASGKGPDMIDLVFGPDNLENYVSAGMIEDLNPYLLKDEELKREDFVPNVLSAYELDGKLYGITPSFSVRTIIGKVSDVGSNENWTIDEMIALADANKDVKSFLPYATKDIMLNILFTTNQDVFVNSDTGECNFTGEDFKKILEFANSFDKEAEYNSNGASQTEQIRNGDLLLLEDTVASVQQFQMYAYMFGEPVNCIGYPTEKGTGTVISPNGTTVAMSASSKNKDGVWEYIHFLLSEKRQKKQHYASGGFSTLTSALEEQFIKDSTPEYYTTGDGSEKEKPKGMWGGEDYSLNVYAATPEELSRIRKMIETADSRWNMDDKMFSIISEESKSYFEGQKSVDEVAELIQSRVVTYVNESR